MTTTYATESGAAITDVQISNFRSLKNIGVQRTDFKVSLCAINAGKAVSSDVVNRAIGSGVWPFTNGVFNIEEIGLDGFSLNVRDVESLLRSNPTSRFSAARMRAMKSLGLFFGQRVWKLLGSFTYRAFWNMILWMVAIFVIKIALPFCVHVLYPSTKFVDNVDYLSFVDKRLWIIQLISSVAVVLFIYLISGARDHNARKQFLGYVIEDVFGLLLTFGSISLLVAYLGGSDMEHTWARMAPQQLGFALINYILAFRLWVDIKNRAE